MAGTDDLIGRVLDGKYEVLRLLGRGGMGEVYAGAHLQLERPVAIKILHGDLSDKESFVTRFAREARTAARLEHPNAVHIYDFGALESGSAYLVMEFIEGVTLREVIRRNGRFPLSTAVDLLRQAAGAVGAAHARGIVHRDLKPENMMVRRAESGRAVLKVVDFGLAKMLEGQTSSLTNRSELIGTPKYMAPEQFAGEKIDGRVDVYALGCVFFEMLTGRAPYDGTLIEIVGKHVYAEVPSLASFDVEVPPAVEAAMRHALEKEPERRTPSAAELVRELEAACPPEAEAPAPLVIPEPSAVPLATGHTPSEVPTRRGPATGERPEELETRYAADAPELETRRRPGGPPAVRAPGETSDEVSGAVTAPMAAARMTSASVPDDEAPARTLVGGDAGMPAPPRRSRVVVAGVGAAALLALAATGVWFAQQPVPVPGSGGPGPGSGVNSIGPSPLPAPAPAPAESAEPAAEPPEPAEPEPAEPAPEKPAARAASKPSAKKKAKAADEEDWADDPEIGPEVVIPDVDVRHLSPEEQRQVREAIRQARQAEIERRKLIRKRQLQRQQRRAPNPPPPPPEER